MVVGDAGAAEVEGALDFADALGATSFEKEPVDFPSFASEGVFEVVFLFGIQVIWLQVVLMHI